MIGEVFNKNHHEDILKNSSDMPISVDNQKEKKEKEKAPQFRSLISSKDQFECYRLRNL